jgi:hypothetical protein
MKRDEHTNKRWSEEEEEEEKMKNFSSTINYSALCLVLGEFTHNVK